ncbi:MAG: nucleotide sugar dehydrogenase [Bdellovibrionaceae bacterium]|jgi:UDP-N-acetyl-D-glucosamine dehydrogenase|nr:nucleotide sugar dehydrogenase [Pseudobdellovibrionaceae bacterium]
MSFTDLIIKKFKDKNAIVGIVGMGYVGLPVMLRYIDVGIRCIGLDVDSKKVELLNQGKSYIAHIPESKISKAKECGFMATSDPSKMADCDAIILCVPTPLNKYREPDISYITDSTEKLLPFLKEGQVLSLESTTYPGTTEEELKVRIEKQGFRIGENFFLVYSPEREDPANPKFTTKTIPKIVGGSTENCKNVGIALYEQIIDEVVPVSSTKTAEMTKLLENIHRAVNIGLVNEMKIVADKMDIDIHEVIRAASTKPFGFTPYYPGPGLGGHCIPIDPFYLTWKAREFGISTRFIELAGEVNTNMPHWVISKLTNSLNNMGKSIKGSKILILGIAYKKNVDDMRESPSVELMNILEEKGAEIAYSDPYVPSFPNIRKHSFNLNSIELTPQSVSKFDCILLATNHDIFDYDLIKNNAKLIVDTRGVYSKPSKNIVKA